MQSQARVWRLCWRRRQLRLGVTEKNTRGRSSAFLRSSVSLGDRRGSRRVRPLDRGERRAYSFPLAFTSRNPSTVRSATNATTGAGFFRSSISATSLAINSTAALRTSRDPNTGSSRSCRRGSSRPSDSSSRHSSLGPVPAFLRACTISVGGQLNRFVSSRSSRSI